MSDGIIKTIVLTGSGSWTVPSDWNNDYNVIHALGAAATGAGGSYGRIVNFTLTPGATAYYSSSTNLNSTAWFNKNSNAAPSTTADGVSPSVATTAYSGGGNGFTDGGVGGGGGAAGPAGSGGSGGNGAPFGFFASGAGGSANGGRGANGTEGRIGGEAIFNNNEFEPEYFDGLPNIAGLTGLNQGGLEGVQGGAGGSTYWVDSNSVTWHGGAGSSAVTNYQSQYCRGGMIVIQYVPVMSRKTIFLTGSGTWTVPSDWNNTNNFIVAIGAGGGGGGSTVHYGGGGGAYSRTNNINLTVGATTYWSAPSADNSTATGPDAWFNKSTNSAPSITSNGVLAKGGQTGGSGGTGAGGSAASGVGDVKYSGGNGSRNSDREGALGGTGSTPGSDGGGGGAAGPNGPGASAYRSRRFQGGGGGGADSGNFTGTNALEGGAGASAYPLDMTGGSGAMFLSTGGFGANTTAAAAAGATGFGAGGGGGQDSNRAGAAGSTSVIWKQTIAHATGTTTTLGATAGPGGGGGGGTRSNAGTGAGANYGGGAAGSASSSTAADVGNALIVISWLVESASGGNMFLMFH